MRKYGWIKQKEDPRDRKYSQSKFCKLAPLPPAIDLRPKDAPIYDQGPLGSCTGNGIAGTIQFIQPNFPPSRLFIYFNERVAEGTPDVDSGANIRDGITSVVKQGVCSEIIWPYDVDQFAVQPSTNAYTAALQDVVTDYLSLESIFDIKNCLAEGFPVVFGTQIYESFESMDVANSGIVPMPAANEQLLGGHCMVIVGYDDSKQWFIVRNSWGTGWGAAGYCFIPYAFIQQYASDFWTIRKDTGELETETLKCQGVARSGHWPTVRAAHLKQFPSCAVCGSLKDCEVHHIAPFHLHKNLELSPDNLITLCAEYDRNHHYLFGHFLNWKSFNSNVKFDAAEWNKKILNRPQ